METHYLGWERPALHLAAEFLWDCYATAFDWDLSHLLVVLPSSRAGRRLKELLARRAQSQATSVWLRPPEVVTPAHLPEKLLELNGPLAQKVESRLAWVQALQSIPTDDLKQLLGRVPAAADLAGWFRLAGEVQQLENELSGEGVSFGQVVAVCRSKGLTLSTHRWEILEVLHSGYHANLRAAGLTDRYLAQRTCQVVESKTVVLLGTVDLPRVTRDLLNRVECPVLALIHAPPTVPDGAFDSLGWLNPVAWQDASVSIREEHYFVVERPEDQVAELAAMLGEMSEVSPDRISIALGDEALGPALERGLELAGHAARFGPERKADHTAPFQLLRLLAEWFQTPKPETWAALLRHAEVDDWLGTRLGETVGRGGWPALCDKFLNDRLPARIREDSNFGDEALRLAFVELRALANRTGGGTRPLTEWCGPFADLLHEFYPQSNRDKRQPVQQALDALFGVLDDIAAVPSGILSSQDADFAGAVGVLLELAGEKDILALEAPGAIEMTGWLEAHLDDAPVLLVTGFNEGRIPKSETAAPLLPDSLRSSLGLPDNKRRYARDAYFMNAILASRPVVRLLSARLGAEGERLAPSRLLFACDAGTVASRIRTFYEESHVAPSPPLLPHGNTRELARFAAPVPPDVPINKLSVTAFRDYLACPYRFYLRHVLRLESVEDGRMEMAADVFGNLLHHVLNEYGKRRKFDYAGALISDPEECAIQLVDLLRAKAKKDFSERGLPAVTMQLRRLEQRLIAFAAFEAKRAVEGWRVFEVERQHKKPVTVEGEDFEFYGRIDRIDIAKDGETLRIIDYKSGDTGKKPEKIHRAKIGGELKWVDLQLPLYRQLATTLKVEWGEVDLRKVEVGYIVLPKDLSAVQWLPGAWSEEEFEEADAVAAEVMRAVRAGIFWPPSAEPVRYDDGLSGLCRDGLPGRVALLAQDAGVPLRWTVRPKHGSEVASG